MASHQPGYRAPRWLPGGHLQTVYPFLFRRLPAPRLRRERWDTPDGDFIDVDWLDGSTDQPLVVLFHGLEGCSRSHYARALLQAVQRRGWRAAVPHFRGCSGAPNRLPRAYHSGDYAEIDWILRRMVARSARRCALPWGFRSAATLCSNGSRRTGEPAQAIVAARRRRLRPGGPEHRGPRARARIESHLHLALPALAQAQESRQAGTLPRPVRRRTRWRALAVCTSSTTW